MNWFLENWFLIVAVVACLGVVVATAIIFAGLPTEVQKEKIKEWLVWACIEAEKELQSDTGQAKLRQVWNEFCKSPVFSVIAKVITFEKFTFYVDCALLRAKEMLINNKSLARYVYGVAVDIQVEKLKDQIKSC